MQRGSWYAFKSSSFRCYFSALTDTPYHHHMKHQSRQIQFLCFIYFHVYSKVTFSGITTAPRVYSMKLMAVGTDCFQSYSRS